MVEWEELAMLFRAIYYFQTLRRLFAGIDADGGCAHPMYFLGQ